MPAPISITTPEFVRFNRNFFEYIKASGKMPSQVIFEKGRDLRIKTFQGFRRVAWKRGRKGGAWKEQRRRFKAGRGVKVRGYIRRNIAEGNTDMGSRVAGWAPKDAPLTKAGKPMNRWQKAVWQEMRYRQAGVGILGVSLLDRRWRYRKAGRYLAVNKTRRLKELGAIEQTDDSFKITMSVDGAVTVDQRYGIARTAINEVAADMGVYLVRKHKEATSGAFAKWGKK